MTTWRKRAACLGKPTEWFFPERADDDGDPDEPINYPISDTILARSVCEVCPVAYECIDFSVVNCLLYGFWGVGGDRRRRLRRLYVTATTSDSKKGWRDYHRALRVEADLLRGQHKRKATPLRECERCARQGVRTHVPAGTHPEDRNGDGARCGFAVTYARGCRCYLCRLAHLARFQGPSRSDTPRGGPAPITIRSTEDKWLIALVA